jgi:hopanoid biosynthesis associated RND transporter like protein HpnN
MLERLLRTIGSWIFRHPWLVVGVALALSAAAAALLPHLDILTARTALYPPDIDVNKRFQGFLDDFGTTSNLIAVVEGEPDDLGPFVETLAVELRKETDVVADLFYKADVEFFADRAFLYLTIDQMERLHERVTEHKEEIEKFGRINGLMPLLERFGEVDPARGFEENIDIETAKRILAVAEQLFGEIDAWLEDPDRTEIKLIENLFAEELSGREMDREGYLRSHDRRLLFVFIQPVSNSDEFEAVDALVSRSRAAAARAVDAWKADGGTPPTVGFAGLPANGVEENRSIKRDVIFTASVAAVLIFLIILVGFRSIRRGIIVFIPLVLAGLWNLGLSAVTVGHLTLLTSGFTAILFGLGVDYGIFISGRIEEEQRSGKSLADAIAIALATSGRTLLAAGGTTAVAFFVIGTVDFTGFAELGIVAGSGVVLVMLATLFVLPALTTLTRPPLRERKVAALNGLLPKRPPLVFTGFIAGLALLVAAVSVYYALHMDVDFGMAKIMPRNSESMRLQQEMAERSDFQPEFAAVIADDLAQARELTAKLKALDTVARVESITAVLPEGQERKVAIIREVAPVFDKIVIAREDFEPYTGPELAEQLETMIDMVADAQDKAFSGGQKELVASLEKVMGSMETVAEKLASRPAALARMKAFEKALFEVLAKAAEMTRSWGKVGPLQPEDLPSGIRNRFQGKSGRFAIYVFPKKSVYDMEFLDRFLDDVYALSPTATGFPTTHQVFSRLIMTGFRQAAVYAVVVVFLLLFIEFRHLGYALAAILPLSLGGAWMFGVMRFLGISLNYANIIAFPLVIGLAVDYGVYLTHRLREDRNRHPFAVMEQGAVPVFMAALTTLAGIGAICMGEHQGAASLGEALIYGIITSLAAAILVLPSMAAVARDLWNRWTGRANEGENHEA